MVMNSVTVFPDTNVLLHYPPLSQIDWCSLTASEAVKLVICLQVIHELDEKKNDSHLSDRAARAIKEISGLSESGLPARADVTLEVFNREVRLVEFPDTLSPDSKDDRIVHLVKAYQQQHTDEKVAVVTEDYGMKLRCKAHGIALFEPDKSKRLPTP